MKEARANLGQSVKGSIGTYGYDRGNTQAEDQDRKQQHTTAQARQTHQCSDKQADPDFQEKQNHGTSLSRPERLRGHFTTRYLLRSFREIPASANGERSPGLPPPVLRRWYQVQPPHRTAPHRGR